jgi:hypothetical protein
MSSTISSTIHQRCGIGLVGAEETRGLAAGDRAAIEGERNR